MNEILYILFGLGPYGISFGPVMAQHRMSPGNSVVPFMERITPFRRCGRFPSGQLLDLAAMLGGD